MPQPRSRLLFAILLGGTFFLLDSRGEALPDQEIRKQVDRAIEYEKQLNWDKAREIYEDLLGQRDPGLKIRDRYILTLRRGWQVRRHQDISYRKEVLSIEYGQALTLFTIINNTLLDGTVDKKKVDSAKLFRKGLEELDAALGDPTFLQLHLPEAKSDKIEQFRSLLRKTSANITKLSRKDASKLLREIALEAEWELKLNATVVVMEFACGACYAIDDYTSYLTPNQLRELMQSVARQEFVGVGLKLVARDMKMVVSEVDPAQIGVLPNDVIVSIDNKSVMGLTLDAVSELLRGPVGSSVTVELMAEDMTIRAIRLERRQTPVSVTGLMIPNTSVGYLKITGFSESTTQEVDAYLEKLPQSGMKGLILDLRDNSGGVFESAIEITRRFLATGIITSTRHQDPKFDVVYHAKNPNALTIPIVLLIDGDTASAAEVLAGALKDHNRALLVGQTTFGKSCTQCVLKLPNASGGLPTGGLKVTVARFFSPKGAAYSNGGIIPHIFVDEQMTSQMTPDPCFARGLAEMNRLLMAQK